MVNQARDVNFGTLVGAARFEVATPSIPAATRAASRSLLQRHVLDIKFTKIAVRGYTGFRPNKGTIVGVPIIASVKEQEGNERNFQGA